MNRRRMRLCAYTTAALLFVSGNRVNAQEPAPAPNDTWVEEPREVPVQHAVAEDLAVLTALGGSGVLGAWLVLGWSAWDLPLALAGGTASAWVARQSPTPVRSALERGMTSSFVTELGVAAWTSLSIPALLAAAMGAGLVTALLGAALSSGSVDGASPVTLAGAVLLGAAVALATGALLASTSGVVGSLLQQGLLMAAWRAFSTQPDATPSVATPGRPLDGAQTTLLLRMVAHGSSQRARWRERVPLVGPLWYALSQRRDLAVDLDHARQVAGMPRIKDTLQRDVDVMVLGRAVLLTGAWIALPVAASGLGVTGVVLLLPALGFPILATLCAAGAALTGLAGLLLWGGAGVVGALTPWWLARAASPQNTDPQVDERLKAAPRRVVAAP